MDIDVELIRLRKRVEVLEQFLPMLQEAKVGYDRAMSERAAAEERAADPDKPYPVRAQVGTNGTLRAFDQHDKEMKEFRGPQDVMLPRLREAGFNGPITTPTKAE